MIWCRFQNGLNISYGLVEGDRVAEVLGSPLGEHTVTGNSYPLSQVKLLAPIIPPMLYAAGPNHRGHVEGMAARRGAPPRYPSFPEPNFRSVHAIIGPEDNIVVPRASSGAVQPEGQLAVVLGKPARRITSRDEAMNCVFGYTIGNDVSERVWQGADRTMFRGKNCDTFKPLGPWIVTGLDPARFRVVVRHNGQVNEDFTAAEQIWDTATWIMEMSQYTTLHPGDVLMLGTQGADGDMFPGDTIEVEVSDIGVLRNYIVAEE
jgi:2-keto-4-pentenoate hydratase/2-oxohepta-3-ene-1,7-dioic acid hydratase in catechol pathway